MLYYFLSVGINRLNNIGKVYYSDKLKERKIYNSTNIKVGLGEEVNHCLDINFNIEDVDDTEIKHINKELKKMIKPSILSRSKSHVTKELPDKIERFHFVELSKEHKKHYGVYISDIHRKIKDKRT